jgi:hypothetical protein
MSFYAKPVFEMSMLFLKRILVELSLTNYMKCFKKNEVTEVQLLWQEIRQLCSYLQDLKKASAEEMRRSVYANYAAFIRY